jgi:hypothetical protein
MSLCTTQRYQFWEPLFFPDWLSQNAQRLMTNSHRNRTALAALAEAHLSAGDVIVDVDVQLVAALRAAFADIPIASESTDDGLIDAAFQLLADDAQHGPVIAALSEGPRAERYSTLGTIAVGTIALVVLQSHVRIERTSTGKYRILVEKKPISEALLTLLVSKLFGRWQLDGDQDMRRALSAGQPTKDGHAGLGDEGGGT